MKPSSRALGVLLGLAGVADSGANPRGARRNRECLDLLAQRRYEAAATGCEALFQRHGDGRAGLAAARARLALRQDAPVLQWTGRLRGTPEEGAAWDLAAEVHRRGGRADPERQARLRAVALHRERGDLRALARSQYALFFSAWAGSDYLQAFAAARDSYDSALAGGDPALAGQALEGLFTSLYDIGDLDGARAVLARLEPLATGPDRAAAMRYWTNAAVLRMAEGRWHLAGAALDTAVRSLTGKETPRSLRTIHVNLAEVHLELGDLARARQDLDAAWRHVENGAPSPALLYATARLDFESGRLQEALAGLDKVPPEDVISDWAWDIEWLRGRIEQRLGRAQAARAAFERSTRIVDKMRADAATDQFKAWLVDQRRAPFEALFRLQASTPGQALAALETAERAKAGAFLDAFAAASGTPAAPAEEWTPQASLQRLELLQGYLRAGAASPTAALRPVAELVHGIGARQVLFYFEARPDLWLIRLARGAVTVHHLGDASRARRLMEELTARPDDTQAAEDLGRLLLPPASLPARGTPLHVVTDGALENLPLAAVRVRGRYLAQDHPLSFVPSVNGLLAIDAARPPDAAAGGTVLGDAGGDLAAAREEAVAVAQRVGVAPRLGPEATVAAFRAAGSGTLLHLAGHVEPGPRGSSLVLADGRVGAGEVMAWRVGPRLVVLASCLGGARRARGDWGPLAAAFLAAGSRSVVAALTSVKDEEAREFLLEFYRRGGARTPSRALAEAQSAFIAAGRPPSFWSPFVVLGVGMPVPSAY
jgi:tetratricopeptide (TPR) repeat protein